MFKGDNQDRPAKNVETVIGPSVKVEGDFNGDGDVIVEGIVVGNLSTKNHLRVGKNARVQAKVFAQSAFIAGEVSGNIIAEEGVELTSTARIKGDITTNSLAVERGAKINGKITMNGQKKEANEIPAEVKSK